MVFVVDVVQVAKLGMAKYYLDLAIQRIKQYSPETSVYIFLHKITNQRDIVIGTLSAGRQHVDLERIVGLFVNTLPIRVKMDSDPSLQTFMQLVKENVNDAIDNQGFQYQKCRRYQLPEP